MNYDCVGLINMGTRCKLLVIKYTSSFGFSARILHLKGEKIFGSTKHKVDLQPKLEVDSHQHD